MNKWIAEFDLEDGDIMPEHMDLEYKGAKIDFHCRPLEQEPTTKNDLGVDCIDRNYATRLLADIYHNSISDSSLKIYQIINWLNQLPSVTPQLSSELEKNSKKLEKNFGELDCISRADAIRVASGYCHPSNVAKELANLPSVTPQEPRWIPVSERLLNSEYGESDSVLVCFENQTQDVLYFNGSNWCYPTGEIYISVNHKNDWHNKVIAWMPLPKGYEEVNK